MTYDSFQVTYVDSGVLTYVDQYGLSRPGDSETLTRDTDGLLKQLRLEFGDDERRISNVSASGKGSTYGGLDVLTHVVEHIWPVVAGSLGVSAAHIIRALVDLKKSRKVTIVFTKDGKRIQTIDVTGSNPKALEEILRLNERDE